MEIRYRLTQADVLALAEHRARHAPAVRRLLRRYRLAYLAGFGLMGLGLWLLQPYVVVPATFLALGILSFPVYPACYRWRIRRRVSRRYRDDSASTLLGERTLRVTADGLGEESELGTIEFRWNLVDGVTVTPKYIFVSVLGLPCLVIPSGQFGATEYEQFAESCRHYIEGAGSQGVAE